LTAESALEIEVRPPWPFRLPGRDGPDGVLRVRDGVVTRLLHVAGEPVVVRAWRRRGGEVVLRAAGASDERLEVAIERMRFALGVDEDLRPFYERFRADPMLAPAIRRMPWLRPRRRPWPWEALAWAITKQLIDSPRAAAIQRRIVYHWGARMELGMDFLRDVPGPEVIASRAPAELEALDLSAGRAIALIRAAREVAKGRANLFDPDADERLRKIREIGPWTLQCMSLFGRGDPDSLPAGDLGYIKLVGRLTGRDRRATVEEVEEFFAPYEPYRGLAGTFILRAYHGRVAQGPPLRLAA
jgi:3-methyladenine DNA glycosylase/8-oxoguanine DNA glycosylase